jgi:hypothetical protein
VGSLLGFAVMINSMYAIHPFSCSSCSFYHQDPHTCKCGVLLRQPRHGGQGHS